MFKRMSVFVLICMSVAVFSACNDSSNSNNPPLVTPIEGTYFVTYFATVTENVPLIGSLLITSSTQQSTKLDIGQKMAVIDQTSAMIGEVVVSKNEDGSLNIISQIQMAGGAVEQSRTDKFQYTEYSSVMPAVGRLSGSGEGVIGYNLDTTTGALSTTPTEFATSPFTFTLVGKELTIEMTLKGKQALGVSIDAVTTVKAEKISDKVVAPNKKLFFAFDAPDGIKGMYDVTLFIAKIPGATINTGTIISNNCALAITNKFATSTNCTNMNEPLKFKGQVAVNKSALLSNMADITAKVQMSGGIVEDPSLGMLKYMYIKPAVMPGLMTTKGVKVNFLDTTGAPSSTASNFSESESSVEMSNNNNVITIATVIEDLEVTIGGATVKLNVDAVIIATKTTDVYTAIPNTLFPQ